uniref:Uncharacterized protein n=1 Tax=Guillardia theta TaxID=55529 RepID=A0A6U5Y3K3_GUITH|mmetsp:Transcript_20059/g.66738  ORF Transcript_20059/g.66738 Transcript_20059/m.66738 type:complete len:351 (+) Transcript_20059:879-1931(+)
MNAENVFLPNDADNVQEQEFLFDQIAQPLKGIPLEWYTPGWSHAERGLKNYHYRLLCVLVLFPLLSDSPNTSQRIEQLKKHWKSFRDVFGFESDIEAQQFLFGFLQKANLQQFETLAMAERDLHTAKCRKECEDSFMKTVDEILNTAGGETVQDKIYSFLTEVQTNLENNQIKDSFQKYRESSIAKLDNVIATETFAPQILSLRSHDDTEKLKTFQLITEMEFQPDSSELVTSLLKYFADRKNDSSTLHKYQKFPVIFRGLVKIQDADEGKESRAILDEKALPLTRREFTRGEMEEFLKFFHGCRAMQEVKFLELRPYSAPLQNGITIVLGCCKRIVKAFLLKNYKKPPT